MSLYRVHSQGEGGILAAQFESPETLLLARGSAAKPTFERIKLPKDSSTTEQIQLTRILVRNVSIFFLDKKVVCMAVVLPPQCIQLLTAPMI